jgi:predicted nucleic acid-binding protein
MTFYLDSSVVDVYLFGLNREPQRYPDVVALFEAINAGQADAVISVYTVQEVATFCRDYFPPNIFATTTRLAIQKLMNVRVQLVPLLTRLEKIQHARRFPIRDGSDQPHVILAYLYQCDALVAYDEHFQDTAHLIPYLRPNEALSKIETASQQ